MPVEISKSGDHVLEYRYGPDEHDYFLNGGQVLGVTTAVNNGFPGSVQLDDWRAKQAADYAIGEALNVLETTKKITKKKRQEIVKASKTAHEKPLAAAGDIGTILHEYACATESGKHYDLSRYDEHPDNRAIRTVCKNWLKWKSQNKDVPLHLETLVASPSRLFAGRFDRLAKRGDKIVLSDYKTSAGYYLKHWIQLMGYSIAIEEWLGVQVDEVEIVRADKRFQKLDSMTLSQYAEKIQVDPETFRVHCRDQFMRCLYTSKYRLQYERS